MNKRKSPRLFGFVSAALAAGGLLIGLPTRAISGTQPATPAEARQMAQDSLTRAQQFRELGGVAYKNGLVQREQAAAARYDAKADKLEAEEPTLAVAVVTSPATDEEAIGIAVIPPTPPATSLKAEHYAKLAAHYRFIGGAAYKTGMLQSAEANERKAQEALEPTPPAPETPNPICLADKPDVMIECPGESAGEAQ